MQLIGAVIRSENESVKFIPPLKPITLKKRRLPRRASFMGLFLIEKFVRYIVCSLFQDISGIRSNLFSASQVYGLQIERCF